VFNLRFEIGTLALNLKLIYLVYPPHFSKLEKKPKEIKMKTALALILAQAILISPAAFAIQDGSTFPACTGVANVCIAKGYLPGEHKKDGKGLWADCVSKVAKGKAVAGVSATDINPTAAQGCMAAYKASMPAKK
jgi:hypothetical protein